MVIRGRHNVSLVLMTRAQSIVNTDCNINCNLGIENK